MTFFEILVLIVVVVLIEWTVQVFVELKRVWNNTQKIEKVVEGEIRINARSIQTCLKVKFNRQSQTRTQRTVYKVLGSLNNTFDGL